MSIPIKEPPTHLIPMTTEFIWPGDDAVDLEASDLVLWAKNGGRSGLIFKDKEKPTVFKFRRLEPHALNHYFSALYRRSPNANNEAFRYGLVSCSQKNIRLFRDRPVDIEGLHDDTIGTFSSVIMPLPKDVLEETMAHKMSGRQREEVGGDLSSISLPQAMGYFILSESFPER